MAVIRVEKLDTLEIYVKMNNDPEVCWEYTKDLRKARLKGTKHWTKTSRMQQKWLRKELPKFQKGDYYHG
jgi:hypothetical protein